MGCWKVLVVLFALVYLLIAFSEAFERMGCDSLSMFPHYQVEITDEYGIQHSFVTDSIISHDPYHVRFETYNGDTTFYKKYTIVDLKAQREERRREEKERKERRKRGE